MFIVLILLSLLPIFLALIAPIKIVKEVNVSGAYVIICVAARNEEVCISECLESLLALNYPKELFEIHVANDGSTDDTNEILKRYESSYEQIHVLQVDRTVKKTKGKARALAQLTKGLACDYIAFTDADVVVTKEWLRGMLSAIGTRGLISGTTLIGGRFLFDKWQGMDWLIGQLQLQLSSRFLKGTPTAMGNNMLVNTEKFFSVGGYEELPFSVTEDVSLQKVFERKGYKTAMCFGQKYLALTRAENSWGELVNQRHRWGKAVLDLPIFLVFFLTLQGLFFPLVMLGVFNYGFLVLLFIPVKLILTLSVLVFRSPLAFSWSIFEMLSFEFYQLRLMLGLMLKFVFFEKIVWKDQRL